MLPYVAGFIALIVFVIVYAKFVRKTDLFSSKDKDLIEIEKDVENLNKMVANIVGN